MHSPHRPAASPFRHLLGACAATLVAAGVPGLTFADGSGVPGPGPTAEVEFDDLRGIDIVPVNPEDPFDSDRGVDIIPLNPDDPFDSDRGVDIVPVNPENPFDGRNERPLASAVLWDESRDGSGGGLTSDETGFEDARLAHPEARLVPVAFPNPSLGPVTVAAGGLGFTGDVYDVSGRRVAPLDGSTGSAVWDGRDTGGRSVSPGVYLARLRDPESGESTTVRLVRR